MREDWALLSRNNSQEVLHKIEKYKNCVTNREKLDEKKEISRKVIYSSLFTIFLQLILN